MRDRRPWGWIAVFARSAASCQPNGALLSTPAKTSPMVSDAHPELSRLQLFRFRGLMGPSRLVLERGRLLERGRSPIRRTGSARRRCPMPASQNRQAQHSEPLKPRRRSRSKWKRPQTPSGAKMGTLARRAVETMPEQRSISGRRVGLSSFELVFLT